MRIASVSRTLSLLVLGAFVGFGASVPTTSWAQGSAVSANVRTPFGLSRTRADTPQALYELGERLLKRGSHDEAITQFEQVRNRFPFNAYSILAELRIADCLYEKSDYLEASDAYRRFARLHPRDENVAYAAWRSGDAEMRLAPRLASRDQTYSFRALGYLLDFRSRYPESEWLDEVEGAITDLRERLGRRLLLIGNYYLGQKEWAAAANRYEMMLDRYGDTENAERAIWKLALCAYRSGDGDLATERLSSLLEQDPDKRTRRRAEALLRRLESR